MPSLTRIISIAGLWALFPLLRAADQPAAPPPEETMVLPTIEVRGQFPAEGWVYARIGQMEFLSQLSAKATRELADDLAIFQDFVRSHYPEAAVPADRPVTVVVCNRTDSLHLFDPSENRAGPTSLPHSDRFIVIDARATAQVAKPIRRRWITLAYQSHPSGPHQRWSQWALRETLAAIEIVGGKLEIGWPPFPQYQGAGTSTMIFKPHGPAGPPYSPSFRLSARTLLKLDQLFQLAEPLPTEENLFAASMQAAALMHMCQFSARHGKWREPYRQFVRRLESEPFSEKLFRECFGMSTARMQRELSDYLFYYSVKYERHRFNFSPTPAFEVRKARPGEVLHLLRESQRRRKGSGSIRQDR